jgi:hypothetical protein
MACAPGKARGGLPDGAVEDAGADVSGKSAQVIGGLTARDIEQAAQEATGFERLLRGGQSLFERRRGLSVAELAFGPLHRADHLRRLDHAACCGALLVVEQHKTRPRRAAARSVFALAGPIAELSMASVMALRLFASVRRSPARSEPEAALSAKARAALLRPLMYRSRRP